MDTDHIGGNYAAALNFEPTCLIYYRKILIQILALFRFGNVWGVDYDSSMMIVIKLGHQQV